MVMNRPRRTILPTEKAKAAQQIEQPEDEEAVDNCSDDLDDGWWARWRSAGKPAVQDSWWPRGYQLLTHFFACACGVTAPAAHNVTALWWCIISFKDLLSETGISATFTFMTLRPHGQSVDGVISSQLGD
ncbi:hypothetical protein DFH08DRAFT_815905 [Mycena albidolilacea]|uniref:Uncharacterized protein n=1 Tax=Mycena albidolilacea TaxID=1033008 RepID=A0AAD6ZLK4_9AGAR|nr:hypothetical protein DFH08DRAFT_815905 [Mycena albidolilacea]